MAETTFENAQVGDKVWDVKLGWGFVASMPDGEEPMYEVEE